MGAILTVQEVAECAASTAQFAARSGRGSWRRR